MHKMYKQFVKNMQLLNVYFVPFLRINLKRMFENLKHN